MSKVIEITKCEECPHFKSEANIPFCTHRQITKGQLQLEYDLILEPPFRIAKPIPEWCPLEDSEDFAESNFNIDREGY